MKNIIIILLILIIRPATGQEIKVLDNKSGQPLEGVFILSGKHSTLTGKEGTAKLDHFEERDILIFQHPSYRKLRITKQAIREIGGIVKLEESPVSLDEIVVSVSRTPQRLSEIPNRVESVGAVDLLRNSKPTTADLAGNLSDVYIQKSQQGGGSPMIRGFSANRLLMVIDGIRMNNAIYRSGNLHNMVSVDANSLERMEIIPGPGSVIYGSDALGGVISFTTARPTLSTGAKVHQEAMFMTRYASSNSGQTIHGRWSAGSGTMGILLSATYSDFSNLIMGRHGPSDYLRPEFVTRLPFSGKDSVTSNPNPREQLFSGYRQLNLISKLRYRPSQKIDLNLGMHFSGTNDVPRYDRLMVYSKGRLKYGDWYYGEQPWWLWSADLVYNSDNALFDRLNLIAGYQIYEESRHDRNIDDPLLYHRTENLDLFSLNADFSKKAGRDINIQYGIETVWNRVSSSGISENLLSGEKLEISPRYPDQSVYRNYAGYLSAKYKPLASISLHSGIRLTLTEASGTFSPAYGFPFSDFDNRNRALNGNVGITWHPAPFWQVNLLASTGFRAPNIDDIGKVFDSEPGNVIVPNPDLKPEYARNLEAGVQKRIGNRLKIEAGIFYTYLHQAIVRRDFRMNDQDSLIYNGVPSKVQALVNADAAYVVGATLTVEYHWLSWLLVKADITHLTGEDSDGYALRHVPPINGSASMTAEYKKWYAGLNLRFNGSIPYDRLSLEERDKPYLYLNDENGNPWSPGWYTLNLQSEYRFTQKIRLSAAIENLLDRRYRPYSSGIAAPGRDVVISLYLTL